MPAYICNLLPTSNLSTCIISLHATLYITWVFFAHAENPSSAAMARLERKQLVCLFLWLLVFMPIKPFYSERPYVAARPPPTKGDLASSHPQPDVHHGLSCGEDHINATLARADVTRWLNPIAILTTLSNIFIVAIIAVMVMYVLVMAAFWCCHLGVHWTISGRNIRPQFNNKSQRYIFTFCTNKYVFGNTFFRFVILLLRHIPHLSTENSSR